MPKVRLTDIFLRSAAPGMYWDDVPGLPGFGCRVGKTAKTFVLLRGATGRRLKLGRYPHPLSLSKARDEAKQRHAELTLGIERPARSILFSDALTIFLETAAARLRPRTISDYRYRLTRHWLPLFGNTPLSEIRRVEISTHVDRLISTPTEANQAIVCFKVFCSWAVRKGYIEHNPADKIALPARLASRDRVLSDRELKAVMKAAEEISYPYGTLVSLAIRLGQRRGELVRLHWKHIDKKERTISMPADLMKGGKEHLYPYPSAVQEIFDAIPFRKGLLFPAARSHVRGKRTTVFNGWSKAAALLHQKSDVSHRFHDYRRVFASRTAETTPPHVIERILAHSSGTISPLAQRYNRYSYLQEMRDVVSEWNKRLDTLLD